MEQEDPFGDDQQEFENHAMSLNEWTDREQAKYIAQIMEEKSKNHSIKSDQEEDQVDPFGEDQEDFDDYALSLSEWTDREAAKYNALLDRGNRLFTDQHADQEVHDQVGSKDDLGEISDNSWFEEASLSFINLQEGEPKNP